MSAFTKPPNDGSGAGPVPGASPGAPKVEPAPAVRPVLPRPPGPSVVVTRTIDVGGPQKSRPTAPMLNVSGPKAEPAPAAPKMPTLRLDLPAQPAAAPAPAPARPVSQPPARPSAPPIALEESVVSIADTFERLLTSDLEKGFDAIEKKPGAPPTIEGMAIADFTEVRALFAQLAAGHVRPVRDFLMDLRWAEATIEWIPVCVPALTSLRRAADKLELTELCASLDAFSAAMAAAKAAGSRTIEGATRDALLAAYEGLAGVMPQAFALDLDRSQRESLILQSLLLQVPGVQKVTLDKLTAAGLTSLEAMRLANPGDVAATTGIDDGLAKRIVTRFGEYHAQIRAGVPDATRTQERERIAELTRRLRREHDQYEQAGRGWSGEALQQKKEARVARARTLLEVQVMLARLGEVERLKELERLPFERKVTHLESFLEEARDKYVAQP